MARCIVSLKRTMKRNSLPMRHGASSPVTGCAGGLPAAACAMDERDPAEIARMVQGTPYAAFLDSAGAPAQSTGISSPVSQHDCGCASSYVAQGG